MMLNKKLKKVFVLNGYAPDKLYTFSECKSKLYEPVLMDNHGDNTNADNFKYIIDNKVLDDSNNYVLITGEDQLDYIATTPELLELYKSHIDQFISIHFNDPSYLPNEMVSKLNYYSRMKKYAPLVEFITGKDIKKRAKDPNTIINHAVKYERGTGSSGVILIKSDNYKSVLKKLDDNETYIFEPIYIGDRFNHFWSDIMITKGGISIASFECDTMKHLMSTSPYWNPIHFTSKYDELVMEFAKDVINEYGILSGIMEPEFAYDIIENKIYLIDHNPRWSAGTCYGIHKIAEKYLPKDFDILDYYFKGKVFKSKYVERGTEYYYGTTYRPVDNKFN